MEEIFLFRINDLSENTCITVSVPDGRFKKEIFAVMHNKQYYVYENSCPHTGGPLDWMPDQFLDVEKDHIQCSTHHALFRIEDGYCVAGPCSGQMLKQVTVKEVDGRVMLEI